MVDPNIQMDDSFLHGIVEQPIYRVVREIGDRHVGPMEYHVEACASEFYLCASCGPKDRDAALVRNRETVDEDVCADCGELL